jgi:hypothetical protein
LGATLQVLYWLCAAILGAALLGWASEFSIRYNTWSTRLRARHPHINPPPTPAWRESNTRIMTWMILLAGLVLLISLLEELMRDEF